MKEADFKSLQSPDVQLIIERYLNVDPLLVALQTSRAEIAEQVKYLQRAQTKLPSWYSARCVIDSQLFEQSSSEATAREKFADFSGRLAIDLTCGLGVDSAALSSHFERVIAIEIDPIKADVARYNFARLSIENVEVKTSSAELFCQQAIQETLKADLIYIDPSRVGHNGQKVYSLQDSSPNVLEMLPLLRRISDKIIIKLSPLFDVDECFRLFDQVQSVDVVSVNGECKEVNILINTSNSDIQPTINHTVITSQSVRHYPILYKKNVAQINLGATPQIERRYLYVPDVAFYKSRCVENYVAQLIDRQQFTYDNYIFTSQPIADFAGSGYQIEYELPYNPHKIKALLDQLTVKSATIHLRNFNVGQAQLYKSLKIKEGSSAHLFFTMINKAATCFIAKPLNNK